MALSNETITFLSFILIGMLFCVIFDFFRALRKIKKVKNRVIYLQDIIYFLLIGIILIMVMINYLEDSFRVYLLIAIILGAIIYISIIGNKVMRIFVKFLKMYNAIIEFIFIPLLPFSTIFKNQINILKKYVIKCCKKMSYMINFYCKKSKQFLKVKKQKKEVSYAKSR